MAEASIQKKGFFRRHWFVYSMLMIFILAILGLYITNQIEIRQLSKTFEVKERELVDNSNVLLSESSKKHHVDMARTMSWVVRSLESDSEVLSSYFSQVNTDGDLKEVSYFDAKGNLQYSSTKQKVDQRIRPSVLNKLMKIDELTIIDEKDAHIIGVPIIVDGKRSGVLVLFGKANALNLTKDLNKE